MKNQLAAHKAFVDIDKLDFLIRQKRTVAELIAVWLGVGAVVEHCRCSDVPQKNFAIW